MRWKCPACGSQASTKSTRPLNDDLKTIYYQCSNLECSATFTVICEFSKFISRPSGSESTAQLSPKVVESYINNLNEQERENFLRQLKLPV